MSKPVYFPTCSRGAKDCSAYTEGKCIALEDTNFTKRPCPFYMSRADSYRAIIECEQRKKKLRKIYKG